MIIALACRRRVLGQSAHREASTIADASREIQRGAGDDASSRTDNVEIRKT
jgi:hypothetical protein